MQFTVAFDTPNSPDLNTLSSSKQADILRVTSAAAAEWARYLDGGNVTISIGIRIDADAFGSGVLASAGSENYYTDGTMDGTARVYRGVTEHKLISGTDLNGSTFDIIISLTPNAINNYLWFRNEPDNPHEYIPNFRYDAMTTFQHEIGHGLGLLSFSESLDDPYFQYYRTVYDTFIERDSNNNPRFNGTYTNAAVFTPVILENDSLSHLKEGTIYGNDLMSTSVPPQDVDGVTAIDLAMLRDIGISIRLPTPGNDIIYAPLRSGTLSLGDGDDTGYAGQDGTTIYGDAGNDHLYGSFGASRLYGGLGSDYIVGSISNDFLFGDDGADRIFGGAGFDYVDGGIGNDELSGGVGNDSLTGGDGDDVIYATDGSDNVYAGLGSDLIYAGREGGGLYYGGAGIGAVDTVVLDGLFSGFEISGDSSFSGWQVRDIHWGDGTKFNRIDEIERLQWSDGSFSALGDRPWVIAQPSSSRSAQVLTLSSLFQAGGGTAAVKYQLWDGTTDIDSGHFIFNGVQQVAATVLELAASDMAQASFVTGRVSDSLQVRVFDGVAWSQPRYSSWSPFTISILPNRLPVVSTPNLTRRATQTVALSSMFSATDADNDSMTKYQIWDSTPDAQSGRFLINGVVQAAGVAVDVSAAQLSQTSFVAGTLGDSLWIRAFDGIDWGNWSPFNVTIQPNRTPAVTTPSILRRAGQTVALSNMFSVTDADGDTITQYQVWDGNADAQSGHFEINGAAQATGVAVNVSSSQVAQTGFVAGAVSDNLWVRAFDGIDWSGWSAFTVTSPVNNAPVVTTPNLTRQSGQTVALSNMFSVTDADSDAITQYQVWDGNADAASGHFEINGVAKATGVAIDVSPSQVAQTNFIAGSVADNLWVRAFDGVVWSSWSPLTVSPPVNRVPVVTTNSFTRRPGQTIALADMFSVNDADGDTITQYQVWDSTSDSQSGRFEISGTAQPSLTGVDVSPSQLAQTNFITGNIGDSLWVRANDGSGWGEWSSLAVTAQANRAPIVTTPNIMRRQNQTIALSTLFSAIDPDGDTITQYQVWDGTADAQSGRFVINGVSQPTGVAVDVSPSQLAQTNFVTGNTLGDNLWARAYDGAAWSGWSAFTSTPTHNNTPVVTAPNISRRAGQSIALSSLFSVQDGDGDAMTRYQIWDSTSDLQSGKFTVNNVTQPTGVAVDVALSQVAQTKFVTGTNGDQLWLRAYDGIEWSAWSSFTSTPTDNNLPVVSAQNLTRAAGQVINLSDMFSVADVDGDTITKYQIWDSTSDASSGVFKIGGVSQPTLAAVDVSLVQLPQTTFDTGTTRDLLWVRASDSFGWGAWSPFTVGPA